MRAGWMAMASSALVLCIGAEAAAYCVANPKANVKFPAWRTLPITYRVSDDLTDAKILAAIDAAFTAWGSVPCSTLKFTKGAAFTPCYTATGCPANSVPVEHDQPYIFVFWVTGGYEGFKNPSNPSLPFSSYSPYSQDNIGGMKGASIAVNAIDYKFVTDITGCTGKTFDVRNFMMPEIGTVIGLAQSNVKPSVMDGAIAYCSVGKYTLTDDDKNGLYYHYSDGTCPKPPQPGSDGCSGSPILPDGGTTPRRDGGGGGPVSELGVPIKRDTGGGAAGQCTASEQCAPGETCDSTGHCVGGDDGCCRVSHAGRVTGLPAALLLAALLLLGRRRRR